MLRKNLSAYLLKASGLLFIALFALATIYPLAQTIMISIKPVEEFTRNPLGFPTAIRLHNYVDAWVKGDFSTLLLNTVFVTGATVLLVIFLASPAGFALSKLKLKGEKFIYNYFMLGIIIPVQTIMIPLMRIGNMTQMNNKLSTLVIVYTVILLSFPILLYTGFYKSIPYEIIEAARMDGCSIIALFGKIIFPMTASINLTVAIFVGKEPWRDFFVPLIFSSEKSKRTLAVGLFAFQGSYYNDWTIIFAMIVLISLPLVLLYIFAQKSFISGIIAGSVKG
jgi:raffinose/stachyose/melibiose transport system permease protein